ncbi:response regulator [Actibacterium pelagium]|uniref:histidine kinase n=1 Tax=Actibacterium pelagium TaxID=2029103 RepID=A0A917AGZ7_9RHOB|nr:response regulator [Actibacterium pelagium]GGE52157.1 sensor histidine kinase [Actibacterium pelagium]
MEMDSAFAAEKAARIKAEEALEDARGKLASLQRQLLDGPSVTSSSNVNTASGSMVWGGLDHLGDGIAIYDRDHRLVTANAPYLRNISLDLAAVTGLGFSEILHNLSQNGHVDLEGQDPEAWHNQILERWSLETIPDATIRLDSGKYFKIKDRRTPNGEIVSLVVDVSDLMQICAGINTISDGFVIYDRDEKMVLCNQRYKEIYKLPPEIAHPGNSFKNILQYGLDNGHYAEAIGREDAWLKGRLEDHRRSDSALEQPLSDGRWLRIEEAATPDGGRVGLRVDISHQKAQQKALDQARAAAEAANRAKSAFLANMSHELRTPMNGVVGMADILCETRLTDEQRLYADTIRNSGESLLKLLNDVLDFSKIEADKLTLHPEPFNLEHTIHEVVMLLRGNAIGKGLELYIDYDLFHPTSFIGDQGRIRQILTNLIGNAVKFTEAGHILVRVVGIESDAIGQQQIHITVEDTGIGISEEMQSHIFGEFNQVEDVETRRFQGTGLGLAITKRLVELMDGDLWVESTKGSGSCFGICLTLPITETKEVEPETSSLENTRILVVDDQEVNRTILERQFTPVGAQIVTCASGPDALRKIESGATFDLIITDFLMPEMDGIELSMKLKEARPETPIVMLTSDPTVLGRPEIQTCVDKVLQKPSLRKTLHETLTQLINGASDPQANPSRIENRDVRARLRILAAEDNQTNRLVFRKFLEGEDIDLTFAENGQQAVDAYCEDRPDMIFMDVSMPEMDGKTATRIIREMEQSQNRPPIPIIALTAHALPGDDAAFLAVGMNAYLTKPLRRSEILTAIQTHSPSARTSLVKAG